MRNYKNICVCTHRMGYRTLGACVRETHIEIRAHARKSNEGLYYRVQLSEPTLEEVTRACVQTGFRVYTYRQYASNMIQ